MRLFLILLFVSSFPAAGQVRASLRTGYGTYSMQHLKVFQSQLAREVDYPMRATARFPGYFYYEGMVLMPFAEKFFCTGNAAYGSTGGRLHYADYSGEIKFDQLINYFSVGASVGISDESANGKFVFGFSVKPAVLITNLDLEFLSRIGDQKAVEAFGFRSMDMTLQPEFTILRKIGRFGIEAAAGYNFQVLKGKLFLEDSQEAFLLDTSGKEVHADWTGARLAVGLSYAFK